MALESEYKITKRRAVKVEQLPEPPQPKRIGYNISKDNSRNRHCVFCPNPATHLVFFKVDKRGTMQRERYCEKCLDKWVILPAPAPETVPTIGK